jgi:acyl carrier protein
LSSTSSFEIHGQPSGLANRQAYFRKEMDMTLEKVREMIANHLGKELEDVQAESTFEELGIDSLEIAELVMDFEDEMGVELTIEEPLLSVGAFYEFLEKQAK